jgi:hypothetical protein
MIKNLKPLTVDKCLHKNKCYDYHKGNCQGCNIWNYLYDSNALIEWCNKHGEDVALFTMKMHYKLED